MISVDTHRQFFYCFTVLFEKHVTSLIKSDDSLKEHEDLFKMAGFNGCIGSSDTTHVPMLSCASWATKSHKGAKLNVPLRTYNITVNHKRERKIILIQTLVFHLQLSD